MPTALLLICVAVTVVLIAVVIAAPGITVSRGGKILAFLALFILPVTMGLFGMSEHMVQERPTVPLMRSASAELLTL